MAHSDPVIAALQVALQTQPSPEVHRALGARFLALQEPAEALAAFTAILAENPADINALGQAARAAEDAGHQTRATQYRQLHQALGGVPDETPVRFTSDGATPEVASNVIHLAPNDEVDPNHISFVDVGGLETVKRRIDMAFLAPLRDPALFKAYGKSIKGGLLLYGPPGCGKTHIARATAGEVGARFTSIGLVDVLDMWIGESERKLHALFETAHRNAPTLLFLDELDALGQKRSQLRHNAGRKLVNQLLVELDGLDSSDGVYVLAATNHPWDVDPALKRPGRFDRTVLVPPPDEPARSYILERQMKHRPQEGLDFNTLAAKTRRYSGADLVHLVDSAIDLVLEEALRGSRPRPVKMADFHQALKEITPSIGPWAELARNYAIYANEGGTYDDLATWLKEFS